MYFNFMTDLETHLKDQFQAESITITADPCPAEFDGDITLNCFLLARQLKTNPMKIAETVTDFLTTHKDVLTAECVKAFVNVAIAPETLFRDTIENETGLTDNARLPETKQKKILVEFSAPNTNKPQHLGHIRNNIIGMTLVSILKKVGHTVIPVNLVNDRGIHICKSMIAYQLFGNGVTPESTQTKGDHLVGDFYVRFDKEIKKQVDQLKLDNPDLSGKTDEELFLETELGQATQKMLVDWEKGDPDTISLWKMMNGWVFDGFDETYQKMGITFEHTYKESDTYKLGKDIITKGLKKGVFTKKENGAVIIDFKDKTLGEKVVLRSDGTSVYITQDIGTTILKHNDFEPDSMIWVVADEQIYHFRVLFGILKALGYKWAEGLYHLAYGMVNLPSGRMKSREGTVVDADDMISELERLAKAATLDRSGDNIPDNIDERAAVIGMGSLKFMLQKVNPKSTLMFDPEAAVKFEGDTGPYILYAYARLSSILRNAGDKIMEQSVSWNELGAAEEKKLALQCSLYGRTMQKAAADYDCSALASYLLDLSKSFNRFYKACPVMKAETTELKRARLELCRRTRTLLKEGLDTLTIGTLESM